MFSFLLRAARPGSSRWFAACFFFARHGEKAKPTRQSNPSTSVEAGLLRSARNDGILVCLVLLLAPLPSAAQEIRQVQFSSGSGVVIDMLGHVITNRHVLRQNCAQIMVVIEGKEYPAQVVVQHPTLDLVLLQVPTLTNPSPLPLRDPRLPPTVGQEVLVLGFPGDAAIRNELHAVSTQIMSVDGPMKEPYWLQFRSAAQQGNSGGPLVDRGGNVIGIVQGKTEIRRIGASVPANEAAREADVAINATEVARFLDGQNVHYSTRWETMTYTEDTLRRYLAHSIPNVRCIMPDGVSVSPASSMPAPEGYELKTQP